MDLETENQIAAILLKEAAELRRQAEKEGVHAYLRQPKLRGRPNSRFLTATVLGVQQSNKAVEVNEMWRVRQKELQLDDRLRGKLRDESRSHRNHTHVSDSHRCARGESARSTKNAGDLCSSSKRAIEDCLAREDEGLRDDEVEEFLQSRVKRGRGAVGSRMDETGPYLERLSNGPEVRAKEVWENRIALGPEKPPSLKSCGSSGEDSDDDRWKKSKTGGSGCSKKQHSGKHRSRVKSRDKKKEKRHKHHK